MWVILFRYRSYAGLLTILLLCVAGLSVPHVASQVVNSDEAPAIQSSSATPEEVPKPEDSPQISDSTEEPPTPPEDPCLTPLYRNWREFSQDAREADNLKFDRIRIVIDRTHFVLVVEGVMRDGSTEALYQTPVALGSEHSPTPAGEFVINHIYCYPDVTYFDPKLGEVPGLYKGFFAPLLLCDERGHCGRYRELGLHGYDAAAYPRPITQTTYGPASAGCIRVSDPCKLKTLLIRLVGVEPLKKDDRGCYHWLHRPVEVLIEGDYPWMDEDSSLEAMVSRGLKKIQTGLEYVLGLAAP